MPEHPVPEGICGQAHPMPRHAKLTCNLKADHTEEHRVDTPDGYRLHWCSYQAPMMQSDMEWDKQHPKEPEKK